MDQYILMDMKEKWAIAIVCGAGEASAWITAEEILKEINPDADLGNYTLIPVNTISLPTNKKKEAEMKEISKNIEERILTHTNGDTWYDFDKVDEKLLLDLLDHANELDNWDEDLVYSVVSHLADKYDIDTSYYHNFAELGRMVVARAGHVSKEIEA